MIKLFTELKTGWHDEWHGWDFFRELGKLPLLSLHTMLDGLEQRIVRSLARHFAGEKTGEEIRREWERGACRDKSSRAWMREGGWLAGHFVWMLNYDRLREVVDQAEWRELVALRSNEEALA